MTTPAPGAVLYEQDGWRPVGRVPDAVLRDVERQLQHQSTTTTEAL